MKIAFFHFSVFEILIWMSFFVFSNFNFNLSFNWNWNKIWIYRIWLWFHCLILFIDFYFERWLFSKQNGQLVKSKWLKCFKGVNTIKRSQIVASTKTEEVFQQKFFKTEETNIQGNKSFHILMIYSNAINISVIIGSIMAASTKTLEFISVIILKLFLNGIPEKRYSGRMTWTLRLWTSRGLNSGRLDSASVDSGRLDAWTLDA